MKSVILPALIFISINATAQTMFPYQATLTDLDGNEVNSSTFNNEGNPIVLDFWGSFCKPCIVKYNAMMEVYEKWQQETGVKIIIVSIDHERMQSASLKLIEKYDWPFEAYFDPNQALMGQLADGSSVPRTYIFNGKNELVYDKKGASIIPKDRSVASDKVADILFSGGSLESLTCDLSVYENIIYKHAGK